MFAGQYARGGSTKLGAQWHFGAARRRPFRRGGTQGMALEEVHSILNCKAMFTHKKFTESPSCSCAVMQLALDLIQSF